MARTARLVAPLVIVLATATAALAAGPTTAAPSGAPRTVQVAARPAPVPAYAAKAALPKPVAPKPATTSLDVSIPVAAARRELLAVHTEVTQRVAAGEKPVVVFDIDDTLLTWPTATQPTRQPVPGALAYLQSLKQAGAKVVYITGRRAEMRAETIAQLQEHGFPVGADEKLVLNDTKLTTVDYKAAAARDVVRTLGKPLAVFDNEKENARVFRRELPDRSTAVFRLRTTSEHPDPGGVGLVIVVDDFTSALPKEVRLTAVTPSDPR